jgi:hypothetical protein
MAQELFGRDADVLDDLAQKKRRQIPASVKWNRRSLGRFPGPQRWHARHL